MTNLEWNTDPKLKNDLQLLTDTNIPQNYESLFCNATQLIAPFVSPKRITVFFVRDALNLKLTAEGRIAEWMPNVIIYNLSMMEKIDEQRNLMTVFLEELVHAYFCSFDENFVAEKVAEIYPKISYNRQLHKYEFTN